MGQQAPLSALRKQVVLFDLGGTLVEYYARSEFLPILEASVRKARDTLCARGIETPQWETVWERAAAENYESPDHRVRPLEDRLGAIFRIHLPRRDMQQLMRDFMAPIFAVAHPYPDAIDTLQRLSNAGYRMAIVSNAPWGSPASLWHEEVARLGLDRWMQTVIICGDVGWRKPVKAVFELTLERLNVAAEACLFVGDDPRWDVAGPQAVGMTTVLIDRDQARLDAQVRKVRSLSELADLLTDGKD